MSKTSFQGNDISTAPVILPNTILIFAMIYFIIVLSESVYNEDEAEHSPYRKLFYYILLVCDLLALIWINADYAGKSSIGYVKSYINKLWRFCFPKVEKKEESDDIKNFIEKRVEDEFKYQENIRGDAYTMMRDQREVRDRTGPEGAGVFTVPRYEREREIINSKSKSNF